MSYTWLLIEIYNHEWYLGSFYVNTLNKSKIIEDINKEYGLGKWTRYNIG